jgi:Pyridoxamine 5'-phosphate oxidase
VPGDLTWSVVAERLAPAPIFWLHTTGPTGAPDAAPVWGVVVDERVYFYTERSTVKARNIARDPRVLVHLESGADVVIVRGVLTDLGRPEVKPDVVSAFAAKYDQPDERPWVPSNNADFDVLYELRPEQAATWALPDSEASTRRWSVPSEPR